jgi:DNA-binding NarL/FixJ family response regulator
MPDGHTTFSPCGSRAAASLQDVQRDLAQAWRVMLASQTDQALTFVEAIERQLDNLPPPAAIRCREASHLARSAVLASRKHSLAALAIVISEVLVERGAGPGALLVETHGRAEKFESPARSVRNGTEQSVVEGEVITARERDVLSMISQGCSNKHIARTLGISPETVKSHVKRIFSKLSVGTRVEAVSQAMSRGLL